MGGIYSKMQLNRLTYFTKKWCTNYFLVNISLDQLKSAITLPPLIQNLPNKSSFIINIFQYFAKHT